MLTEWGKMIFAGDLPIIGMLFLAGFGIAIIVERVQSLFFRYGINTVEFVKQIKSFLLAGKTEEAIAYCASQQPALLAHVVKKILERSDRDDDQIHAAYELATSEVVPMVTKRLGHLAMIANVATLLGLLGTIHGLIKSFQAVSFADPVQKQTILAQGISIAMNATALGLFVAIPVMIIYSILHARQNKLLEELIGSSKKVVDLLIARHYEGFDEQSAYPTSGEMGASRMGPPAPPKKRSA